MQFLVNNGADVQAQDSEGKTALIWAAIGTPDAEIGRVLLTTSANVNAQDNRGATALIYAVLFDNTDMVLALLDADANTLITDERGGKAIDYAGVRLTNGDALKQLADASGV